MECRARQLLVEKGRKGLFILGKGEARMEGLTIFGLVATLEDIWDIV